MNLITRKFSIAVFCSAALFGAANWAIAQGPVLPVEPTERPDVSRARVEYLRRAAGLTGLRGPGILVTLRDRKGKAGVVRDYDLSLVVNQLRAADAEAIAINGVRVGGQTAVRFHGSSIRVGGQSIRNPFQIEAIGDGARLKKTLASSGIAKGFGVTGPQMSVATSRIVRVPALEEAPTFRFAKPE